MQPDGAYVQSQPAEDATGPDAMGIHAWLMDLARHRASAG